MQREFFAGLTESWDMLKRSGRPVCIYGMGDACERMLEQFELRGIKCSAIFASDDFVRGQSFKGFKVSSLSQLEERFEDLAVCCAFGSSIPDVMKNVSKIAAAHPLVYPDLPIAGDVFFSKQRYLDRFADAETVYSRLADEHSRRVFKAIFAFKITGDISYLADIFTDNSDDFKELIGPEKKEIYADLGAYDGDTVSRFIDSCNGEYERIYLFEPDKRSFRKCLKNLLKYDDITFINACSWRCDDTLLFSQSAGRQSKISQNGTAVCARSLDSVLGVKRCSFIKYDVEGAERQAIIGSERTIKRYKPRLAVSAYHRPFDLIDLPMQIWDIDPDYKIYLRQPPYFPAWDSMIYAIE